MPSCTPTSPNACARGSRLRVWIVSPTTCMATLNTLRAILKDARMREQAGLIRRELRAALRRRGAAGVAGRQPRPAFLAGVEGPVRDPDLGREGRTAGAAARPLRLRGPRRAAAADPAGRESGLSADGSALAPGHGPAHLRVSPARPEQDPQNAGNPRRHRRRSHPARPGIERVRPLSGRMTA